MTSHPMSVLSFMLPHIRILTSLMPVQVFANSNERTLLQQHGVDVPINRVAIRGPSPLYLISKHCGFCICGSERHPMAVHTITSKAGLLGMLAAWLARVPVRVHSFTGQVWVTRMGFMRWLLKAADKCLLQWRRMFFWWTVLPARFSD